MGRHFQRALILLEQGRTDLAEKELRAELAEEPDDPAAHALLATCLLDREQFDEAEAEARQAVMHAPDADFAHRAVARVLLARSRPAEAAEAALEAIRIDPDEPANFFALGQARYEQRDWTGALEAAEQGLALDPEHIAVNNLRAMALVKLGRKAEAGATIDAALSRNPDDPLTHANRGWTLLEQRDPSKALEHFREALRLDPESEWARLGIVEALKARNIIYGLMLRYFLWMAKLRASLQWFVIVAVFMGPRLMDGLEAQSPALKPFLLPVRILLIAFVVMTWIAVPLFNLLLRLNRFGRMALSREQIVASNWVGCALLFPLGFLGAWLAGAGFNHLAAALITGVLVLPIAGGFALTEGWPRTVMNCVTGALTVMAGTLLWLMFFGGDDGDTVAAGMLNTYFYGILASQLLANGLGMARVTR